MTSTIGFKQMLDESVLSSDLLSAVYLHLHSSPIMFIYTYKAVLKCLFTLMQLSYNVQLHLHSCPLKFSYTYTAVL